MSITGTSFETNYLNISYQDADLTTTLSIRDNPLLKYYKIEEEGGSTVEDRFMPSGARGFSGNLVDAQTVSATTKNYLTGKFDVPFGKYEGSIRIPWADILRSRKSDAAGAKALDSNVQTGLDQAGSELVRLLVGAGGHAAGFGAYTEAASGVFPTFAIRFVDGGDARNLQIGDLLQVSAGTGEVSTDSLVAGTGYVLRRSVENGWVQVADFDTDITVAGRPGAWVDVTNYYVWRIGEYVDGDSTQIIVPIAKYLPSAAPAAPDSFLGLLRSDDEAYSGVRLTSTESKGTTSRRLKKIAAKKFARYTKKKGKWIALMNPEDWDDEEGNLSARANRDVGTTTEEGYDSFTVNTSLGKVDVVSEPYKNKGSAFCLDPSKLRMFTPDGKLVAWVNPNGDITRLFENTNDLELRPFAMIANCLGAPWSHGYLGLT